ncbi:hypothetical protein F0562_003145 [Nyssa sinensis]|uniref:Uncharacterized protein n=1 Tax=Nyssa sinensis TaxID=561372 RepID=A0A5J5BV87_9ASTE|nr:hypothetical protein F0562_003145 [Nyssa sinensis]
MFHLQEDILVSYAQSPEHLNTNVMAPPQAASEFVLDGYGATLDNSLTFSDRSPMSPVGTYVNNFLGQVLPQRMLTDPNSILDFNCLRYPSVYDCHS